MQFLRIDSWGISQGPSSQIEKTWAPTSTLFKACYQGSRKPPSPTDREVLNKVKPAYALFKAAVAEQNTMTLSSRLVIDSQVCLKEHIWKKKSKTIHIANNNLVFSLFTYQNPVFFLGCGFPRDFC